MQILDSQSAKLEQKTAVALGMFDGVHLGHREVIQAAIAYAKEYRLESAVITLANHPRQLTQGKAPQLITNLDSRLEIFSDLGLDYALVLDFDEELMNMSAQAYLQKYLLDLLNVQFISTGYDHHFGKDRSGSPEFLETWSQENKVGLKVVDAFSLDGLCISSSKIRDLLAEGKVEAANKILGYPFMVISQVIEGDKRGRDLGFPTANLKLPEDMVIPAIGVYAATVNINDGQQVDAVVNVGTRPSFNSSNEVIIEAHLLNFNEDIYGAKLRINFERRLRDEKKFASVDELKSQIAKDIEERCMK